jgi:hypothetical protein
MSCSIAVIALVGRGSKRLESAPQPFELGLLDAGADATGVDQPSGELADFCVPAPWLDERLH